MTYTIKEFKVSEFTDPHGNTAVNVAFEEFGEPVTWFVKDPSRVTEGQKLDGEIKEATGRSGKSYNRFYRDKPQQQQGGFGGAVSYQGGAKREYKDNSDGQRQGMCINNAAQYVMNLGTEMTPEDYASEVKRYAQALYSIDLTQDDETESPKTSDLSGRDIDDRPVDLSEIPF